MSLHRSVAFFPQDGQARLPHELVTYLTWGHSGLSQLYSFTPSIPRAAGQHFCDSLNLDIAQTARIQEGCPALVGCEQAFQRSGLKITTTSGHPPSSPLLFRINQNDGRYGRT
ncbi:hypothetical protein WRSd5_p00063 (plasmid) [Shigella dysenteriae WRSd5]|nr:hypothetical protein WRSd5_p00063 [Shigella dysenteriae WRSd5]